MDFSSLLGAAGGAGGGNSSKTASTFDSGFGFTNNAGFQVGGSGKQSQTNDATSSGGTPKSLDPVSTGTPLVWGVLGLAALAIVALVFKK